ncbi:hypothetical protein ANRL1_02302 [Anaerolineae bacterium]|nr:hypothetical protein ANRL1_02302 [Anaerolineae bacterium]
MATGPVFTGTPRCAVGQVTAANTARDGTGTLVNIFTAGASGSRISRVFCKAAVTTTAGMIRLFIYDGSATRLWREYPVTAITVGASTKSWEVEEAFFDLVIPANYIVKASTHNAEACNVIIDGGDF